MAIQPTGERSTGFSLCFDSKAIRRPTESQTEVCATSACVSTRRLFEGQRNHRRKSVLLQPVFDSKAIRRQTESQTEVCATSACVSTRRLFEGQQNHRLKSVLLQPVFRLEG